MAAEKGGPSFQSSRTSMSALVNECLPGSGAQVSKPHAAIVSVTAGPVAGAALAAAQQSSKSSVSKEACSNSVCIADHSTDADPLLGLLDSVSISE